MRPGGTSKVARVAVAPPLEPTGASGPSKSVRPSPVAAFTVTVVARAAPRGSQVTVSRDAPPALRETPVQTFTAVLRRSARRTTGIDGTSISARSSLPSDAQ